MKEIIIKDLPYILSLITIYQALSAGDKKSYAWAIMVTNQVLWLIWILTSSTFGLLPMNIVLAGIGIRNHLKWNKKLSNNQ